MASFCGSCLNLFFQYRGLEILSTSYAGRPGKVALKGNFLGAVRNIRVKISNHFNDTEKIGYSHPQKGGNYD